MTRVVAILAHPDDAEILAGGTLYKHLQRGDSVGICSVTYTPDSVRGQEGAAGAQRLGAEFTCLGLQDMGVSRYTPADVERLTAFFLARPPDLVLTHWLEDPHPDHVASVRLVIEVLLHYAVAHGLEDVDASRRAFSQVWSCDTYGALGSRGAFDPEWYIDISAVWEQKLHALATHQSQTPVHWTELIRCHNAFYGARCHRPSAEGFRRLPLAFVNNLPAYEYLP
jgi:LmbE family N-acetylglucosaminyl deacetylase